MYGVGTLLACDYYIHSCCHLDLIVLVKFVKALFDLIAINCTVLPFNSPNKLKTRIQIVHIFKCMYMYM